MCGRHRWLACVLGTLVALSAPAAHADGRIAFVGRILESTCSAGPDIQSGPDAKLATGRAACGPQGSNHSSYDSSRRVLAANEPDRVLRYFNDYVRAAGPGAQPTLVVRVYE